MTTGKQLAGLLLLTTALTLPGIALAQTAGDAQDSTSNNDMPTQVEDVDDPQEDQGPDISIPGGTTIIVRGVRRDPTQSSTQVVSVLSTEQIARTGEGDIAGALASVTGLSVQGQGFVYVRGLGDRYSLALLNGLALPSPQPLSRVVPLDIFPTSVVASSLVQKTYSANFPGEFGGGVINLTTRAVPDESFLKVSGSISGNTETTFSNGLSYFGSDFDTFGFDDGTRDVPPALQQFFDSGIPLTDVPLDENSPLANLGFTQLDIGKQLGNPNLVLLQKLGDVPANWSAGITAGTSIDLADGQLGIVATASISNKWRTRDIRSQTVLADFTLDNDFRDIVTDNRMLANALLGFGLEIGDHQFRWTNLFIRDSVKQATLSEGIDFQDDRNIQEQGTTWFERQLINSQLVAELEFGDLGIDLRGGYARTDREAPFEYSFRYVQDPDIGDLFVNDLARRNGEFARVVFSDLQEELITGGIDLSYPVLDNLVAVVGYAYNDTERYSERRAFQFRAPTSFPQAVGTFRPDLLLGDAVLDAFDVGIDEVSGIPAFDAALTVHAGYGKINFEPVLGLSIDVGVRYEDGEQSVAPVLLSGFQTQLDASTAIMNDYWLPAGTITWEPVPDLQLRANASKTIARPQFRELVFQRYFDPETNREFEGNPLLVDSELTNYEVRAEYYFGGGDRMSLAGFYKEIDKPIEASSFFSDNNQITLFANAPSAELYGAEFDIQKTFDLMNMGGFFETKELVVIANYTYTQSEISVQAGDTTFVFPTGETAATNVFVDGLPLTGQSDHLANFQMSLEDIDTLQQFSVLVNYSSERVTSRGTAGLPDIVEDPGLTVDLVYRQGLGLFGTEAELKIEARNIFGRGNEEFQSNGTDRIEINTYDIGTTIGASLSVEF